MPVTVCLLLVFLLIAVLPPRLPLAARIAIQVVLGLIIYFGFHAADFSLPFPDSNPIGSDINGGSADGSFAKVSVGFLFTLAGVAFSLVAGVIRFALSKRGGAAAA